MEYKRTELEAKKGLDRERTIFFNKECPLNKNCIDCHSYYPGCFVKTETNRGLKFSCHPPVCTCVLVTGQIDHEGVEF